MAGRFAGSDDSGAGDDRSDARATNDADAVLHLRVALTAHDYDSLVDFFAGALGLAATESWTHNGARGTLLETSEGSVEVFDQAYSGYVDDIEVGQPTSGEVRLALQVPDVRSAVARLVAHGGKLVHPPVRTPWGDLNARVEAPNGLQVTLYEAGGER